MLLYKQQGFFLYFVKTQHLKIRMLLQNWFQHSVHVYLYSNVNKHVDTRQSINQILATRMAKIHCPNSLPHCSWAPHLICDSSLHYLIGMAIPRKISLLEESGNRGMVISHSSGNFEEWVIPKITKKHWKSPQKFEKKLKKQFQHWIYISKFGMFSNSTKNPENKNENKTISTNFWQFSEILIFFIFKCSKRKFSIFEVLDEFWRGPWGVEEW